MKQSCIQLLISGMSDKNSLVCCGLDPDIKRIPDDIFRRYATDETRIMNFLASVIDITIPHVCAYKIQKAFFDSLDNGHRLLKDVVAYIKSHNSCPVFLDCKIGDIDNTMNAYLYNAFDELQVDGVVVNPYMGDDVLAPFAQLQEKAAIVLVKTSNNGGDVVQNITLPNGQMLWEHILELLVNRWNAASNLIPVLSSTANLNYSIRSVIPNDMPILLAGFGAQGGDTYHMKALLNKENSGVFVNSSRGLLYPYAKSDNDWTQKIENAVLTMKNQLNDVRK